MEKTFTIILVAAVIAIIGLSQIFFIVDQREQAILLQLGEPVGDLRGPGLHVKIPFIQSVRYFDNRVLSVEPGAEQVVISSHGNQIRSLSDTEESEEEKEATQDSLSNVTGEPIILDTFARYKITDPLRFMQTLRTVSGAESRLEGILKNATKAALGKTSLRELLSPERTKVMQEILRRVNAAVEADKLGIQIVDIRIVRSDLTPALRTSTVNRMVAQLHERATETRAKGEERALEIRSTAEKERTVLIAEAERDAQILRGDGDREAIKIYADAFNKDQEFYSFIRSMEAYGNTLANPETRLILSPEGDFFRYFDTLSGR